MAVVGSPCLEEVFGECCQVADVDPLPVEVEAQRFRPAVAQRQRCGRFGWVVESVQLGQPNRAITVFDVARTTDKPEQSVDLLVAETPWSQSAA
jgi:hypothetical protein